MLQAPITLTTAKLDISLLLSRSPSPPARSPPPPDDPGPSAPPSAIASSSVQLPPHSHRTSVSSTVSAGAPPSVTSSATSSRAPRPLLPPISAATIAAAAPSSYASFRVSPPRSSLSAPAFSPVQAQAQAQVQGQAQAQTHAQAHAHVHGQTLAVPPPPPTSQPHASAKRPPPPGALQGASPAKKQSKWAAEENAVLIELRGAGMKWEDISRRILGRSAISCRLHYQNYLERRLDWDEEKKDRLARLYERLKPEMWGPLATELGIPWRAAEAMHWQLGEVDMAQRAGVTPFTLTTASPSGPLPPTTAPPSLAASASASTSQAPQQMLYHHHSPPIHFRPYGPDGRRTPFAPERVTRGPGARRPVRRGSMDAADLLGAGPRLAELGTGWEGRGRETVLPGLAEMERGAEPFEARGPEGASGGGGGGSRGRLGSRSGSGSGSGHGSGSRSRGRGEGDVEMEAERPREESGGGGERSGAETRADSREVSRAHSRGESRPE